MPQASDKRLSGTNNTPLKGWSVIAPYAYMTVGCFVIGFLLIWLMLWKMEILAAFGLTGKFFYLILIPLGLSAATSLFGVLHSIAKYRGRQLEGTLELGGPAVVFILVLVLGFGLAPNTGNFPLTIFVHGEGGPHELTLKNTGYVMLDLGGERRRESIGDKGQAMFSEIPANFRGQTVLVSVDADGYELIDPKHQCRLNGSSLYLPLRKKSCRLVGRVQDGHTKPLAGVTITVAGLSTTTNHQGSFELTIPGNRLQKELLLQADVAGFKPWRSQVVPDSNDIAIMLNRSVPK